jgi:hypothetical protein
MEKSVFDCVCAVNICSTFAESYWKSIERHVNIIQHWGIMCIWFDVVRRKIILRAKWKYQILPQNDQNVESVQIFRVGTIKMPLVSLRYISMSIATSENNFLKLTQLTKHIPDRFIW